MSTAGIVVLSISILMNIVGVLILLWVLRAAEVLPPWDE